MTHLPFGPVPDYYECLYSIFNNENKIEICEKDFGNGYEGEIIKGTIPLKGDEFNEIENEILETIINKFEILYFNSNKRPKS